MRTTISELVYAEHLNTAGVPEDVLAAAAERFGRLCEEAYASEYPGADVSVEVRLGVSGVGEGIWAERDGAEDTDIADHCREIGERIFEQGRFWGVAK